MRFQFSTKFTLALLLVLLPALGFISFHWLRLEGLRQRVRELGGVKFIALRASATATAMQHAVRVAPYRALLGSETGNDSEMKAASADGRQCATALRASLDDLAALSLGRDARESLGSVRASMTNYLARVDEIVSLALSGQTTRAHEATTEFNAAFAQLQERLTRMNGSLENEIRQNLAAAAELSSSFRQSVAVAGLAGAMAMLVLVLFSAKFFREPAAKEPAASAVAQQATSVQASAVSTTTTTTSEAAPFVPLLDRRSTEFVSAKSSPSVEEVPEA